MFSVLIPALGILLAAAPLSSVRFSERLHARVASIERIHASMAQGRYPEAVALARERFAALTEDDEKDSPRQREALRVLVEALWRDGKSMEPETLALARRAAEGDERALGGSDLETAASLENLGRVLSERNSLAEAESHLRRTLAIREGAKEVDQAEVASSLNELAWALMQKGDVDEPRALFGRALTMAEGAKGPDDLLVASVLVRWGGFERSAGNYLKARSLHERALAIRERALGPNHPLVAESLRGMGIVFHGLVQYDAALAAFERALSILDAQLPDHRLTALTHMNTANLLMMELGDYGRARGHFERCLAILDRVPIADTYMGAAYQNFATLLEKSGDYAEARLWYERALALRARGEPPDPTSIASCQSAVGNFLIAVGDFPRAEQLLEAALTTQEKLLDVKHPSRGYTMGALAKLFQTTGRPVDAKRMAERALRSYEGAFGPRHPTLVEPLEILGEIAMDSGDTARAETLLRRALSIQMETRGPKHPLTAATLVSLARLEWRSKAGSSAFQRALRAEDIASAHLRRTARVLSEREALRYEAIRGSGLDLALTVVASGGLAGGDATKTWDELVRSRALVLDEMAERHRSILEVRADGTGALLDALAAARNRLARLAVAGPDAKHPDTYRTGLDEAVAQVDRCERALGAKNESFRERQEHASVGLEGVLDVLPADGAVVAYVQYQRIPSRGATTSVPSYLAFIATRQTPRPIAVPLGSVASVDQLVHRWRAEVSAVPFDAGAIGRYRTVGDALRRAIWDPVASHLAGARSVYVVPDGELNLVAFHTLPADGTERYLVETGPRIQYLSAERDLVTLRVARNGGGLLALGGPDFDADPDSGGPAADDRHAVPPPSPVPGCSEFQSVQFPPLPSSGAEVDEIKTLWMQGGRRDVLELTGDRALEGTFKKSAPGRSVIHLATHSFSLDGQCSTEPSPFEQQPGDLLLRSGLAFAGANRRGERPARGGGEDGILTAEEVASLDLRGVEWVVLSGCDTGTGSIQTGEGILGLRRAFEVAGTSTLISTLWEVTDHDAREWIRTLYEGRMAGQPTMEAVRRASLRIIGERRRAGVTTHPFFWGAFVAAGDPS